MEDIKINDINKFRHYPATNDNLLQQSSVSILEFGCLF